MCRVCGVHGVRGVCGVCGVRGDYSDKKKPAGINFPAGFKFAKPRNTLLYKH